MQNDENNLNPIPKPKIKNPPKHLTTVRLSQEAREMLIQISKEMGITHTSVMEVAIRELWEKRGGRGNM